MLAAQNSNPPTLFGLVRLFFCGPWEYNLGVLGAMSGNNRRLVAYEPVEVEKQPVEVQEFERFTDRFGGMYVWNVC